MPIWKKYAHLQKWAYWICPFEYAHYLTFCVNMPICNMPIILKNQKVCPFAIWQKFQKSVEIWPIPKVMNYINYIFICISTLWKFGINICLLNLNGHIWTYTHLQYAHFLVIYKNMPICNMPIFLKILEYAHLQYAHFFQKMGIFQFWNMPKKITYGWIGRSIKRVL